MSSILNIALVGNPNSGKSSLFNVLTGLKQKVGNFPGVTVDKRTGSSSISNKLKANIIDLPGTYSLYPKRADEWVAYKVLLQQDATIKPDLVVLVTDASNLKRNLLFCSQIIDLKVPVVMALTMMDIAKSKGIKIDIAGLERELGVPIVAINPRKEKGIAELKKIIEFTSENFQQNHSRDFIDLQALAPEAINQVKAILPEAGNYTAIHYLINHEHFFLTQELNKKIEQTEVAYKFNHTRIQAEEILQRFARIKQAMQQTVVEDGPLKRSLFTEKLDNVLLHRFWGYLILLLVLFVFFQSIFWIASYPMDAIDWSFAKLTGWMGQVLPQGWLSDLMVNGVLAGIGGIVIFVPQIMIMFGLITLLEDSGYMARISFLTDRMMRKAGLNGKSIMPMISGFACAVPAIMSARNIENKKERLLTILVTPLMSCSARLPVYTILIALVIPSKNIFGFLSLHGLVMMALYVLGIVLALMMAWVTKWFIKSKEKSFFILELPVYRSPRWKNALTTMVEKARIFVVEAGKVIIVISLILWAMSSYGPSNKMQEASLKYDRLIEQQPQQAEALEAEKQAALLEHSYAGIVGKAIEPAIEPLGYDWKIGIALITSFAAREVFVGTMATLYSAGNTEENEATLKQKMAAARRADGTPVYTLAAGLSLLVFYVIALQCMSTLAIVKRETRSWKWPVIQFTSMTVLAYLLSWITYIIFN
ncbi:MAG TPA: ferrous iron transport protein B [Ferruginibacter sp.]|nr:ferrous iron transport protein B [Ferruginibacter sp.]HRE63509.1 ferrous iron transport protein B [Ferruginibacter sp.]